MSETEAPATPAAWPTDVIARYSTVVGADVDISAIEHSTSHSAICGGCESEWVASSVGLGEHYPTDYITKRTERDAHRWAQAHAETCRALPKPNA